MRAPSSERAPGSRIQRDGTPRRVLMLLYFFPPLGGISMSRNVRHVQYLPRYGWTPVVLTPRDGQYGLRDASSNTLVPPGTRVLRTGSIEAGHVRSALIRVRDAVDSRAKGVRRRDDQVAQATERDKGSNREQRPGSTGLEWFRRLLFFPDDQVGWLPFAVLAALRLHRRTPFDVIYSTSSPITSHLIAWILKRLTGLPWVAEFRDPWVGNVLAAPLPRLYRRLQGRLEAWIVRSAEQVVCVGPSLSRLYQERYPGIAEIVTIPNGYDRGEALDPPASRAHRTRFRIVYTGTLDRPQELQTFLDGLDALLSRRPELRERIEVLFYGDVSDQCAQVADSFMRADGLGSILHFLGFVPRRIALEALSDADAALVLLGAGLELFVGGKLYDYLGQGRQILAMLPRGDARDVLEGLDWGVMAYPEPHDVERAIEHLLTLPPPDRPADPERRYDREVLAGRLADTLATAVNARTRSLGSGKLS